MIIKDLILNNFGKFNNKEIKFKEGINLVYGQNESGKSTVHTFINGMFLGIEKTKKRLELDTYSQYEPWHSSGSYEGSMRVEIDGKQYRIKRNFNRNKKLCSVIDESSGREIDLGNNQPISLVEGMNESNYINTVSIGQLKSKTDTKLAAEVKTYIANLSSTKTSEINVGEVMDNLSLYKKNLDSKIKQEDINRLETRLNELRQDEEKQDNLIELLEELSHEELDISNRINNLKIEQDIISKYELYQRLQEAEIMLENINSLQKELESLEQYRVLDIEDIDSIVRKFQKKEFIEKEIKSLTSDKQILEKEINRIILELEEMGVYKLHDQFSTINLIEAKYNDYIELGVQEYNETDRLSEKKELLEIKEKDIPKDIKNHVNEYERLIEEDKNLSSKINSLQENINTIKESENSKSRKTFLIVSLSSVVVAVSVIISLFGFNTSSMLISFVLVLAVAITCNVLILSRTKTTISNKIQDINNQLELLTVELNNNQKRQQEILTTYNSKDIYGLRNILENSIRNTAEINSIYNELDIINKNIISLEEKRRNALNSIQEYIIQYEPNTQEITKEIIGNVKQKIIKGTTLFDYKKGKESLLDKQLQIISEKEKELVEIEEELRDKLAIYDVTSEQELLHKRQLSLKYKTISLELDNNKKLYAVKIVDNDIEKLREMFITFDISKFDNLQTKDKAPIDKEIKDLTYTKQSITERKSKLEGQIDELSKSEVRRLEVENEYQELIEKKNSRDKELEAIKLAVDTINSISANIHDEFGNQLNELSSNIIKDITNGKYQVLRLDEDLNVKVDTGSDYVKLEQLSCGTMDQLYFALRLGVADLLFNEKSIPIILDDAFAMYDDDRLNSVLSWLTKQKERQVIIFTCHTREKECLDRLDVEYNYIEL